ncbi:hypothetical protein GCM10022631_15780 [Deinococcus rubellus]|uniref:hypothetical protein n=1 Tax=Deinococcus rubellus TaxID=1889240 RepID=UPI0031F19D50
MMWNAVQLSWFWPLCAVTGLILLSVGTVLFSRWLSNALDRDRSARLPTRALELARERLAKGELTPEEFEILCRTLTA